MVLGVVPTLPVEMILVFPVHGLQHRPVVQVVVFIMRNTKAPPADG
jgi:hypothetical protein